MVAARVASIDRMTPHLTTHPNPALSIDIDRRTRQITLAKLSDEGVDPIGTFDTVADAWAAIDAVDCGLR